MSFSDAGGMLHLLSELMCGIYNVGMHLVSFGILVPAMGLLLIRTSKKIDEL